MTDSAKPVNAETGKEEAAKTGQVVNKSVKRSTVSTLLLLSLVIINTVVWCNHKLHFHTMSFT